MFSVAYGWPRITRCVAGISLDAESCCLYDNEATEQRTINGNLEGLVMAGEAQILAQWLTPRLLRRSAPHNDKDGRGANYAKQSQFSGVPINANCCLGMGLGAKRSNRASAKTKPISRGTGNQQGVAPTGGAWGLLGGEGWSRTPDDSVRLSLAKPGPDGTMNRLRVRQRRIRADYPIWSSN